MPICKICKERIALAYRGVRAYRCSTCKSTVCKKHFDFSKKLCHNCAGIPYAEKKRTFIRGK